MLDDLRGALRRLWKNPGASAAAVLALGIGIGFNTAIYSVADALLLRPLPIPEIDRVVMPAGQNEGDPRSFRSISPADYREWRTSAQSFQSIAVSHGWSANLTGAGDPVPLEGAQVTASLFDVLQVQPLIGRAFLAEEEEPGKDRSVLLSHNLWQRQFGSDPSILGRSIELSGRKFTVTGVMPKGITFPQPSEFWVPLPMKSEDWNEAGSFYLKPVARLRPGVTLEAARAELQGIAQRMSAQYPVNHRKLGARVESLRERISGDLTASYTRVTVGAALSLLLIACLNVASLQFAHVVSRTREMAIRGALGAPRLRLVRQVLTESVLVALTGAVLGLAVAVWSLDLIKANMPAEVERWLPGWQKLGINGFVLACTTVTAMAAGLLSGLGPALWLSRTPILGNLHDSGRGSTGSAARQRLRNLLVGGEIALATVLLAGAVLMVKGFHSIGELSLAVNPAQILTLRVNLPQQRYPDHAAVARFQRDLLDRLTRTSGVASVAVTSNLPYSDSMNRSYVTFEGRPDDGRPKAIAQIQNVSGGFFSTLGVPILDGRPFDGSEAEDSQKVAIVTSAFVRQYFPDRNPMGRRFHLGDGKWWTIKGIAGDVAHDFTERSPQPVVYLPYAQSGWGAFDLAVRTAGEPMAMLPAVRSAVRAIDPAQPLALIRSFRKLINDSILGIGHMAAMLTVLAAVALFLSVLGIYSLMAWSVRERTREIGVRVALGAQRGQILRMILKKGAWIAGLSLPLGLAGAVSVARLLSQLLFGVSALDILAFIGMPLVLALALTAACLVPAQRATRTDPLTALRHE